MIRWLDSKLRHKAWYRKWRGLPEPMPITLAKFNREMLTTLEQCLTFTAAVNRDYAEPFVESGKVTIKRPTRYARLADDKKTP